MPKTWLLAGLVVAAFAANAQDANISFPVAELERMLAYDPFTIVRFDDVRNSATASTMKTYNPQFTAGR